MSLNLSQLEFADPTTYDVSIPKFKIESSLNLKEPLQVIKDLTQACETSSIN